MQEDLDLAARYSRWDTEDLARAATAEASDYRPEALAVMRLELERRGHAAGPDPLMAAGTATAAEEGPRGVGGVLLLFVALLGLQSIVALSAGVGVLDASSSPANRLIAAGWLCGGAYGMVCCLLIGRRSRRAPSFAALWIVAVMVLTVVDALHDYFVTGTFTPGFLSTMVYSGIWLTYLSRSQRVKATFGTSAGW